MRATYLAVGVLCFIGCRKKNLDSIQALPTPSVYAVASPSNATKVTSTRAVPSVVASAKVEDTRVPSGFVFTNDFVLPEGKVVPLPKVEHKRFPASFEADLADKISGYRDRYGDGIRTDIPEIPATYVWFSKENGSGRMKTTSELMLTAYPDEGISENHSGFAWHSFGLLRIGGEAAFNVYGTGATYILRSLTGWGGCRAETVLPDGSIASADADRVPMFPAKGKDLDGDLRPEFPSIRFSYEVRHSLWVTPLDISAACQISSGTVRIDVLGVTGYSERWSETAPAIVAFYEKRQRETREKVAKVRTWSASAVDRAAGNVTMNNECALDVAQTAAELFVYARTLGDDAVTARAESDAVMKGFKVNPIRCGGVKSDGPASKDIWPDMRDALFAAKITTVRPAAPAPSASSVIAEPSSSTLAAPLPSAAGD